MDDQATTHHHPTAATATAVPTAAVAAPTYRIDGPARPIDGPALAPAFNAWQATVPAVTLHVIGQVRAPGDGVVIQLYQLRDRRTGAVLAYRSVVLSPGAAARA